MNDPAPPQLHLPPAPGYCTAPFCTNRLSAANVDGVCDECRDLPLTGPNARVAGSCVRCHVRAHPVGDNFCAPCRAEYNREYYTRRKAKAPPDKPCARCGQPERVAYTSYCRACATAYQAQRQQRRVAARSKAVTA